MLPMGLGEGGDRDGGPAHSPARLPASAAAGSAPPGHGPCPPEEGGGRPPREQCGRLFCRLSASFPDPPFHAPWPNRHRPGTQREEPPYLVLERKGKGYPQMPAALGHRPAVVGPHPAAVPSPAGRWRRRAAPRGGAQSGKQAPQVPVPLSRGLLLCARWEGGGGGDRGRRREGAAEKGEEREKKKTTPFLRRQSNLGNRKIGFSGGRDFALSISCDPFARARADAGVRFRVRPAVGMQIP